jgi:hypothetical protein
MVVGGVGEALPQTERSDGRRKSIVDFGLLNLGRIEEDGLGADSGM